MSTPDAGGQIRRCTWASNDLMIAYHDTEWGVPLHDDQGLFEFLILEGAQAGLSWDTILRKRPAYRAAFAGFDPAKVAAFDENDRERLLADAGIVRNRLKIDAASKNARAFLTLQDECGSFDAFIWRFVDGSQRQHAWQTSAEVPISTPEAHAMSKDLKRRGFTFVGPTICYSLMQAVGMVNDHLVECFRHAEVQIAKP